MKAPTPDFTKDSASLDDIVDWVNQGYIVKSKRTLNKYTRYSAYWDGKAIVVYEAGEVEAQ